MEISAKLNTGPSLFDYTPGYKNNQVVINDYTDEPKIDQFNVNVEIWAYDNDGKLILKFATWFILDEKTFNEGYKPTNIPKLIEESQNTNFKICRITFTRFYPLSITCMALAPTICKKLWHIVADYEIK